MVLLSCATRDDGRAMNSEKMNCGGRAYDVTDSEERFDSLMAEFTALNETSDEIDRAITELRAAGATEDDPDYRAAVAQWSSVKFEQFALCDCAVVERSWMKEKCQRLWEAIGVSTDPIER